MMKRAILFLMILFAAIGASAQVATVSGNLKDLGVNNATQQNTYVIFTLQNFKGIPRVVGTNSIVSQISPPFKPDGSGNISGSIQENNSITPENTFYQVCVYFQGNRFQCNNFLINANFNLNTAIPLTQATFPLPPSMIGLTASIPATCTVGMVYFATDATPGDNLFFCTALNTWTQQLSGGGGSPGGSTGQLQYNNGGVFGGVLGSSVTSATGATLLTAGADTTTPLAIASHSTTQSATELDVNNQSSVSADATETVRGRGLGSFTLGGGKANVHIAQESQATAFYGLILSNHAADVAKGTPNLSVIAANVLDNGTSQLCGGDPPADGNNNYGCFFFGNAVGGHEPETIIARTACTNCVTDIVPFAVQGEVSQSVDVFDTLNSSGTVLSGFDKGGNFYGVESASITGISGADQFWPNSAIHRWEMVNNNGTPAVIAGFADFTAPPTGGLLGGIVVCSGQIALTTGTINSGTRATNTLSCSGLSASTDSISCTFSGDTNAVTGYAPSASGGLSLKTWVSTNTINVDQVNDTGSSITPGAATVNCKGIR